MAERVGEARLRLLVQEPYGEAHDLALDLLDARHERDELTREVERLRATVGSTLALDAFLAEKDAREKAERELAVARPVIKALEKQAKLSGDEWIAAAEITEEIYLCKVAARREEVAHA
jgi:hypothetical protein